TFLAPACRCGTLLSTPRLACRQPDSPTRCGPAMSDQAFNSVALQDYLDRWQAGDRTAADELLRATAARLEKLARRMCRSFPNVRGWAETGDVLQSSLIRLLRTLQNMRPATTRDFFN